MGEEDRKFLSSLNPDGSFTPSKYLPLATREQDKARTKAKKNGWAIFARRGVWAWQITEAGRQALKAPRP